MYALTRLVTICVTLGATLSIAGTAIATPLRSNDQVPPALSGASAQGADIDLSNSQLRETVAKLRAGKQPPAGVRVENGRVDVEIVTKLSQADARALVAGVGGSVLGSVPGELLQALIPFGRLVALERSNGVEYLRPPIQVDAPVQLSPAAAAGDVGTLGTGPIVGEEVAKTNAAAWQAATWTGADVKVGIVDFFQETAWDDAAAGGELPATPAGTFCQYNGVACDVFTSFIGAATLHGEGVAEIIHEQAPDAELYLATVNTISDLQAAVNYFASEGVDIISRSLTSQYDGPGDGTGPMGTVINNAVAGGMSWFAAAGNNAGPTYLGGTVGAYWRGSWSDPNNNGYLNFTPGDEGLGLVCGTFVNGFRWSDWGPAANRTNYDVHILDTPTSPTFMASFTANQQTGANPIEIPQYPCNNADPVDLLVVQRVNAGSGTGGDVLEYMQNGGGIEYWQNPFSVGGPASDSTSVGAVTIGAIDPPNGTTIATYSSQGPTNDNSTKPDLVSAANVQNYTYGTFPGTSAATPAAAGAAALVLESGLATTPSQLKTYLLNSATTDRGAFGIDYTYGWGELVLGAPPKAGYPRPKGATPLRVSLVPTYAPCTSPNRTHGAPLSHGSCTPAPANSPYITVGTPDANGASANFVGSALFRVKVGAAGPPEDSDVNVTVNMTDIRCRPASGVTPCGAANAVAGSDYTGPLYLYETVRTTDRFNATGSSTFYKRAATGIDYPHTISIPCASTASTAVGSTCSVVTSFNAVLPGTVLDEKRSVLQFDNVSISDGGVDGILSTGPNYFFATQGVFVP